MELARHPAGLTCLRVSTAATIAKVKGLGTFTQPLLEYTGDQVPDSLQGDELAKAKARYRGMPEEFYSETGQRVETPGNFNEWFAQQRCKHSEELFQFQEYWSGSGRSGFRVRFPVDLRYGWDLRNPAHRALLDVVDREFMPCIQFASPSCTVWGQSGNHANPKVRSAERELDRPVLAWA